MSTFDNKKHIDQIIKNNGWLDSCMDDRGAPDNPPAVRVVEYQNAYGGTAYGVTFEGQFPKYDQPSDYIRNPKVIWERRT